MVKTKLNRENHTMKHTHTHCHKKKIKEKTGLEKMAEE